MRSPTVTPKLQRIAAQAARDPDWVFTTLAHLMDEDFLREAYRHTRKSSAPGIDGVTAQSYAEHLDENLHDLYERLRSGRYQAVPVERVWIEKDDGGQRPIGKPMCLAYCISCTSVLGIVLAELVYLSSHPGSRPYRYARRPPRCRIAAASHR